MHLHYHTQTAANWLHEKEETSVCETAQELNSRIIFIGHVTRLKLISGHEIKKRDGEETIQFEQVQPQYMAKTVIRSSLVMGWIATEVFLNSNMLSAYGSFE